MSSDADWTRFLINPNTTIINPRRDILVNNDNVEEEYIVPAKYRLLIDSVTGVDKENVDGIKKLGTKRAYAYLQVAEFDERKFFRLLNEGIEKKKYGMILPEWAKDVEDVYNRNYEILKPIEFEELTEEETEIFLEGWNTQPKRNIDVIIKMSLQNFGVPYVPSYDVEEFFKLSY